MKVAASRSVAGPIVTYWLVPSKLSAQPEPAEGVALTSLDATDSFVDVSTAVTT